MVYISFNIKGKTIYLSLVSIVTLIITISFVVITLRDVDTFGETMKNIVLIIIGYFFNHEQKPNEGGKKNE